MVCPLEHSLLRMLVARIPRVRAELDDVKDAPVVIFCTVCALTSATISGFAPEFWRGEMIIFALSRDQRDFAVASTVAALMRRDWASFAWPMWLLSHLAWRAT